MEKYNLNKYDKLEKNIFFWIKKYLSNKLSTLNTSKASSEFDKETYCNKILETTSQEELKDIQKDVVKYKIMSFYNYSSVMLYFYNSIVENKFNIKSMQEINNDIIYNGFIVNILKDKSTLTKKRFYMITINFFNFIDENSISNNNFRFNIEQNEKDKKHNNSDLIYLNDDEIIKFNNFLDVTNNIEIGNKLLLKIFLFSGISASELINLKVKDLAYINNPIDKYSSILNLHIKSIGEEKSRDIPLPKIFVEDCFMLYKEMILDKYECKGFYPLFFLTIYTNKIESLSLKTILQITKKAFQDSGINKNKITTEIFRNTFAIYLKNQRFEDKYIQKLLGHQNLKATYAITKHATKTSYLCSDEFELLIKK